MLKATLIENAIRKARLNPSDPKITHLAELALQQGIRKFSADSTITSFHRMVENVTLNEHTAIGRPLERRGYRITKVNELPSLTGYDPDTNNFGIIMGKDYYYCNDKFYGIHQSSQSTYVWQQESNYNNFLESNPDIIVWDMESIIGITDREGLLDRYNLLSYNVYGRPEHSYCDISMGNGQFKVMADNANPVTIVYSVELDANSWDNLPITYDMANILELYIGEQIARTEEVKSALKNELEEQTGMTKTSNIKLPTLEDF